MYRKIKNRPALFNLDCVFHDGNIGKHTISLDNRDGTVIE